MTDTPTFAHRYRIQSSRLPEWNYAGSGSYFITICTDDRIPWFGDVRNGMMGLSDVGSIVHQYWADIPHHFPHVSLDAFVVMPDHIHGILICRKRLYTGVETSESDVSTDAMAERPYIPKRPESGSVGSIINQFKSVCTKRIRAAGHANFAWQPRFHDHIIRDDHELQRIRTYIINNPRAWKP